MDNINKEIGQRLRAIRELCEWSGEELAQKIAVGAAELESYEAGEREIPVSVLHNVSAVLGISTTELMTGENARLHQYCLVRKEKGVAVERSEAYRYRSLAYNFAARQMEPLLISIPAAREDAPFLLNTHSGQEFHYCLEGAFAIQIGTHTVHLEEGDSIYFNSAFPHGMKALGGKAAKSLVVITLGGSN
ncbi:MAG: XRE family transcriptional regulator [Oscillospiraceae bacterium]|jgi:transcriptional regulator with XRE-family HTH domain|nr:XRE family transcriptional regulator [Oscillospiraceae bacterium]